MVAAWSVDRLGRSLKNLVEVLSELHAKGVDLYLHQQGLDTSTPSGRAMFQMMAMPLAPPAGNTHQGGPRAPLRGSVYPSRKIPL